MHPRINTFRLERPTRPWLLPLLTLVSLLFCCRADTHSTGTNSPTSQGSDGVNDPANYLWTLAVQPSGTDALAIPRGESLEIVVTLEESDGTPVPDQVITFTLSAQAQDSGLEALSVMTGSDGVARNTIFAGSMPAVFDLNIYADAAKPLVLGINAGPEGYGWLEVVAPYTGTTTPESRVVYIFGDTPCAELLAIGDDAASGPLRPQYSSALTAPDQDVESFYLLATGSYTILAEALDPYGLPVAQACAEQVLLESNTITSVPLVWADLPVGADGVLATNFRLTTTEVATEVGALLKITLEQSIRQWASDLGDEEAPLSQELYEAGYLLRALQAVLRTGPSAQEPEIEAAIAEAGNLETIESLHAELTAAEVGPFSAVTRWLTILEANLQSLTLEAELALDAVRSTTDEDGLAASYGVTLTPLALQGSAIAEERAPALAFVEQQIRLLGTVDSDAGTFNLNAVKVPLPLPDLTQHALRKAVLNGNADTRFLAPQLGCNVLQSWASTQATLTAACDADCITSTCSMAMTALLLSARAALPASESTTPLDDDAQDGDDSEDAGTDADSDSDADTPETPATEAPAEETVEGDQAFSATDTPDGGAEMRDSANDRQNRADGRSATPEEEAASAFFSLAPVDETAVSGAVSTLMANLEFELYTVETDAPLTELVCEAFSGQWLSGPPAELDVPVSGSAVGVRDDLAPQ